MSAIIRQVLDSRITLIGVLVAVLSPLAILLARAYWNLVEHFLLAGGLSELAAEGWGYFCAFVTIMTVAGFVLFRVIDRFLP